MMKKPVQVLVIDDDVSIRTLLDLFLRKDYQVISKKDGIDAMVWLESGNIPDIIISDMNMPRLNGTDFLINLKKSGFYRSVPVFILSGQENQAEKKKMLEYGAYDYILKPFNPSELLAKLDAVVKSQNDSSDASTDTIIN